MNIQHWPDAAIGAFVNRRNDGRMLFVRTMEHKEKTVSGVGLDGFPYELALARWQWIERPTIKIRMPERDGDFATYEPDEWDGQGLPPVGIECEALHDTDAWCRVKVIGKDEDRVVFRWMEGFDKGTYRAYTIPICFRPLRTAEQLAAEQRQSVIDAMCIDANEMITEEAAGLLHDAGYRK